VKAARWLELLACFLAAPALLVFLPGIAILPTVVVAALLAVVGLRRDPSFDRRQLWSFRAPRPVLLALLARTIVGCALLTVLVLVWQPARLFFLPRHHPLSWLAIVLGYPLLSVYPQELLYRAFFFQRYRALFPRHAGRIAASALLFGYGHIVLHNAPSIALTLVGGLLFGLTYERTRSLPLASLEHAIYGSWLFTVGLGDFFYSVPLAALLRF
jgi:membrane protease YdiL (CAAX protease family)